MTAYEMRISDWSSDVCSSDLGANDLTAEMGCPGQVREPAVIAAFERIAAAANRYGKIAVVGGVQDDEYYLAILEMGFSSFIFAGIATDILADGMAQRSEERRVGHAGVSTCRDRGSPYR